MHLDIRGRDFTLTPPLLEHLERCLRFVLARFDGRVTRVSVRIAAATDPQGGVDKRCRIGVRLRPVGEVFVEGRGPDLYAAIDIAVERIMRSMRREVERMRDGMPIPLRAQRSVRSAGRHRSG